MTLAKSKGEADGSDSLPAMSGFVEGPAGWARLSERLPALAISGEETAVDLILYEVLHLLVDTVGADTGQINLLPKGGRVEKVCILKDGRPWLRKGMDLHLFDPYHGFTGRVVHSGESIRVDDIWKADTEEGSNPFLDVLHTMHKGYVEEIKRPLASIMIVPVKRGQDIFCTIELGRYRHRRPFTDEEKARIENFGRKYGSLIIDYILDVKNRIAIHTAHRKLLTLSRLIASNQPVDYKDAVEAYMKLSAADIGFAFFKTGDFKGSNYRCLVWRGEHIREVPLDNFVPSEGSILRADSELSLPVEGEAGDARLANFRSRIRSFPGLEEKDRRFILSCVNAAKSYVAYPLHLLGQDLGAIVLGSRRVGFWEFLHMNPFLDLYNSLLKSFLLNERLINRLSNVALRIHNPGFYYLGALKTSLIARYPLSLQDPQVRSAMDGIENLFDDLHEEGTLLRCREKNIRLVQWIQAFVVQRRALSTAVAIEVEKPGPSARTCTIRAREEQLEAIFENLFSNSLRAINRRRRNEPALIGTIRIQIRRDRNKLRVLFQDNGIPYPTVSGRGVLRIRSEVRNLGGTVRIYRKRYRVLLSFPCTQATRREGST